MLRRRAGYLFNLIKGGSWGKIVTNVEGRKKRQGWALPAMATENTLPAPAVSGLGVGIYRFEGPSTLT